MKNVELLINNFNTMTKWLSLEEGTTVYIPAVREKWKQDNEHSVFFRYANTFYRMDDQFLTEEELKAKFNEWLPKQGEMIEVRWTGVLGWSRYKLIAFYEWKVITEYWIDNPVSWDEWRPLPKKTELTLAEVEEKLWLEKGSLIIKD